MQWSTSGKREQGDPESDDEMSDDEMMRKWADATEREGGREREHSHNNSEEWEQTNATWRRFSKH